MNTRRNRHEYWQQHVSAYYTSGLSQKEYCRQADIGYWSFNQWKRRIENQEETPSIMEVHRKPTIQDPAPDGKIEIRWNNSLQVSLPVTVSPETLTHILKSLGECTCR